MYEIYSMRADVKARLLNNAGEDLGLKITGSDYKKNALFFVFLLKKLIRKERPDAIMFRYFNDHKNIIRSLFLAFNIISCVLICSLFKIEIFWVLHNVDKETEEHYPSIIKFLRFLVGSMSKVIFVTDPLLIQVAKNIYPKWKEKIDYITFGENNGTAFTSERTTDEKLLKTLKELNSVKSDADYILFCPTAAGDKYTHLHSSELLVETARSLGLNYIIVIVGNLTEYLDNNESLKRQLTSNKNILLFDSYTFYDPREIAPYIDCYWRALSDQSVSFTLYEAASLKKPILTLGEGFMGKAVENYSMGAVTHPSMIDILDAHKTLGEWDDSFADTFLEHHSWSIGAKQIYDKLIS